jgi:pyridoxamine 5'-phosphate oxidase family protein
MNGSDEGSMMSVFTDKELEYLATQRLGRLATINQHGHPQNAPVSFRYNPEEDAINIGGRWLSQSQKFKNVIRHTHVAFVVDDVQFNPSWHARGVEIRGVAEQVATGGKLIFGPDYDADDAVIRIHARQIISWGLEGSAYASRSNRKVEPTT